jgi:type II secretory pathway component HofQ
LTFDNTPLQDVIKAFRDTTGANLITAGTNLNAVAVSMRLDNVPWKQGLDSILIPHGLEAVEQPVGSGIYIIRNKSTTIPKFTKAFKLSFARSADVAQLFKSAFDLSMPVGTGPAPLGASANGMVSAFPSANTVIVTASQQQLDECEKILSQIDVQRPHGYIEARFVEVDSGASKKLGLKWDSLGTTLGWGATFKPDVLDDITANTWLGTGALGGPADVGLLSIDDFKLTMNLFESMDGVTTFSNPRVIIANEEQAIIDMTIKEPNVTIRSTRTGTDMNQLDVTAELQVIPGMDWPKDIARHCFATYHAAAHGMDATAEQLGHGSTAMLHKHYKGLARNRATAAARYFAIQPATAEGATQWQLLSKPA